MTRLYRGDPSAALIARESNERDGGGRQLGVDLVGELARVVDGSRASIRGRATEPGRGTTARLIEGPEKVGLGRPEAPIESPGARCPCRGDDLTRPSVSGIQAALDQIRPFEIIEEVGHDGAVDAEVLAKASWLQSCPGRRQKGSGSPADRREDQPAPHGRP